MDGDAHCASSFPDLTSSTTARPDPVITSTFLSTPTMLDTAPYGSDLRHSSFIRAVSYASTDPSTAPATSTFAIAPC